MSDSRDTGSLEQKEARDSAIEQPKNKDVENFEAVLLVLEQHSSAENVPQEAKIGEYTVAIELSEKEGVREVLGEEKLKAKLKELYLGRGNVYDSQGKLSQAIIDFDKVAELSEMKSSSRVDANLKNKSNKEIFEAIKRIDDLKQRNELIQKCMDKNNWLGKIVLTREKPDSSLLKEIKQYQQQGYPLSEIKKPKENSASRSTKEPSPLDRLSIFVKDHIKPKTKGVATIEAPQQDNRANRSTNTRK